MNIKEKVLTEIEATWCDRMTNLVSENRIWDADALYQEYVLEGEEPFDSEWVFIPYHGFIA